MAKKIKSSKDPVKAAYNILQHIIEKTEAEEKPVKKKASKKK